MMNTCWKQTIRSGALLILTGCTGEQGSYTLYRSSVAIPELRIHVATFDAKDGPEYNRENCFLASTLFESQPGTKTKFWCELGRYKGN